MRKYDRRHRSFPFVVEMSLTLSQMLSSVALLLGRCPRVVTHSVTAVGSSARCLTGGRWEPGSGGCSAHQGPCQRPSVWAASVLCFQWKQSHGCPSHPADRRGPADLTGLDCLLSAPRGGDAAWRQTEHGPLTQEQAESFQGRSKSWKLKIEILAVRE